MSLSILRPAALPGLRINTSARGRVRARPIFRRRPPIRRVLPILALLGPGLISANAGNDAGGIATYASIGASYGYGLLWIMLVITVSLMVVQEMAARLGAVSGKGFADLLRERFSLRWSAIVMASLVVANAVLVVSEFAGIGAAAELFGLPRWPAIAIMAALVWWLVVGGNYKRVEVVFLAMTFAFFAYPVAAVLAKPDWLEAGRSLVLPSFQLDSGYLLLLVATVGTTITPYMQLYLQSATAERQTGPEGVRLARWDAYIGAIFGDLISVFIIIATAATLFLRHISVQTAADAAVALEPIAGPFAGYLFALGLLGASLLAAAVVPLATTYSVTEVLGVERGVSNTFREAPVFMGVFTTLLLVGAAVAMLPGINVIQLLLVTQVINGLLLPFELFTLIRLANDREVLGEHVNGPVRNVLAYGTALTVGLLSLLYVGVTVVQTVGGSSGS
ncbi:MAG: Nramp family divalent metal transporter [Chloroflexi bacterium]|nr:Nramp family divalent metal transporter [Chloroflexota bacterium]